MKREKVIDTVKEFPNELKLEELIERWVVIEKVGQGLTQLKKKKTVNHEKVKEITKNGEDNLDGSRHRRSKTYS